MKTAIYISGFVAAFLLLGWLLALKMGMSRHLVMLASGSFVLFLVYLPLVVRKRNIHRKRMKEIIRQYQENKDTSNTSILNHHPGNEVPEKESGHKTSGWSMNNSPFRERNAGATWGGGNIHAANVTRNRRKR